jgi:hypothetical protein
MGSPLLAIMGNRRNFGSGSAHIYTLRLINTKLIILGKNGNSARRRYPQRGAAGVRFKPGLVTEPL